jgi:hypothetical protein
MRIERHTGLHTNAKQAVAPAATWGAPGTQRSFESALREQRQRITSNDKGSQQRSDAVSSRSRPTARATLNEGERPSTRSTSERAPPSADRRQLPTAPTAVEDSPIPAFVDRALAARWRRAAGTQGTTCIEVVHAASGSRFLLSREDGVWLLSIQSRASPEDAAIVQSLRELFAQRGLGPVDVIKI